MPIMLRNAKAAMLTLVVLFTAGCAQSDYAGSRKGQERWRRAEDATAGNASQIPPPKILPETYFAAGQLFEAQGLLGKAILQYRKAVAVHHEYGDAYHRLGVLLGAIGRHSEASEAFVRAVQHRPEDAVLRNNLGYEFVVATDFAERFGGVLEFALGNVVERPLRLLDDRIPSFIVPIEPRWSMQLFDEEQAQAQLT